jgi:hypothetical protein
LKTSSQSYSLASISKPFSEDERAAKLLPYLERPGELLRPLSQSERLKAIEDMGYVELKSIYLSTPEIEEKCKEVTRLVFLTWPFEDNN